MIGRANRHVLVSAFTTMFTSVGHADLEIRWSTIDGGGYSFSSGGAFELSGTVGQPDAGPISGKIIGDSFELRGGFWVGATAPPEIPGDLDGDGEVDLDDCDVFLQCMTGPNVLVIVGCKSADLQVDSDVDLADFAALQVLLP